MADETSNGKNDKQKSKRKLTPFLCQEMLYDFALDRLDYERKSAVEEFLKTDQECQRILEGIRKGLEYAQQLQKTQLKVSTKTHLREAENALSLGRKYSSWSEWPDALRWSITAIVISTAVAMVVAIIPWSRLPVLKTKKSDVIEIAQLTHLADKDLEDAQEHQEGDEESDEGSGDEEIDAPAIAANTAKPSASTPVKSATPLPTPIKVVAALPSPAPQAKAPVPTPVVVASSPVNATESDSEDDEAKTKAEQKPKSFVYRAFMTLGNLEELGPKITENITELGGEKAGEVELGWKRGTGRYYHFALPQENEDKLLEKLRAYGPVRISKDPHSRVMPRGQVRFILWVESNK